MGAAHLWFNYRLCDSFVKLPTICCGRIFCQAQPVIQQRGHARVFHAIEDLITFGPRANNALRGQPLKLIGHRLRLHPHECRKVVHAQLPFPHQCVQETQPGVVRQHLEDAREMTGLSGGQECAVNQRGFRRTSRMYPASCCRTGFHFSHRNYTTPCNGALSSCRLAGTLLIASAHQQALDSPSKPATRQRRTKACYRQRRLACRPRSKAGQQ